MTWPAALLALLVSHAVGDVLLRSDWQAVAEVGGLGDPVARRALGRHVAIYTLASGPALVWIGSQTSAGRAVVVGALISVPHLLVDGGRLVRAWLRYVKPTPAPAPALTIAVDQSFDLVCLFGAALVAAG
jgi:hypothetical protein